MEPRAERRAACGLRHWCHDAGSASRAAHRKSLVLGDDRHDRGQLDPLGQADALGWQARIQSSSAAGAAIRAMRDHLIGSLTDRPAVTLMAGFGPARLGLLALLLAIGRGRLGGGARGLLRSLQPQHQLDQFFLAQTLTLAPPHPTREPAISAPRKGLSNFGQRVTWVDLGRTSTF